MTEWSGLSYVSDAAAAPNLDLPGEGVGIQRKWGPLRRRFVIENAAGSPVFEIRGPAHRWWTFELLYRGVEVGKVSKQWGGLLKEMFTDADVFGIEELRPLLIMATLLIDLAFFDDNWCSSWWEWVDNALLCARGP
ncbi:MAG: hypothetical protein H6837_14080 [Planctomycetes bacterium]|nr:hypothetical protein [Planctomycetota bacterium]